jgi:hypothetical protein
MTVCAGDRAATGPDTVAGGNSPDNSGLSLAVAPPGVKPLGEDNSGAAACGSISSLIRRVPIFGPGTDLRMIEAFVPPSGRRYKIRSLKHFRAKSSKIPQLFHFAFFHEFSSAYHVVLQSRWALRTMACASLRFTLLQRVVAGIRSALKTTM